MKNEGDKGSVSEWNEGDLKNLRLHEAQELINIGKVNPFNMSEGGLLWNYQIWKSGIDILYGEGQSKYSPEEIEEIGNLKKLIETLMTVRPPFKTVTAHSYLGNNSKFITLSENQNKINEFLQLYERKVKKYNDEHGFSTRNRESMDDGL